MHVVAADALKSKPHLSVVIPVYKAENCLDELYRRLIAALEIITLNFEIVLVEDCGGDRSWEIIERLSLQDRRVKGIQFSRNFGQHYGITAGLDHCNGDWVLVMDCDLQDRPEEIPRLYAKAQEGYDVVLARRGRRQDPVLKRFTSWLFYKVFSYLAGIDYDGEIGNFRIISRKVVTSFRAMQEQLRFFGGLVNWMGFPTASIDVQHDERFAGQTSYTFRRLWALASEAIIANSDKPLLISIRVGFTFSIFSFLYATYLITQYFFWSTPVAGWTSVMVSIYFVAGLLLMNMGILGLYVGKVFDEAKKRPLYIVRNAVGFEKIANLVK
jgi:glycosyltransferase involved in cell wall biosynthesis